MQEGREKQAYGFDLDAAD